MTEYLLALDAGTSSNRAIVFTPQGHKIALAQRSLKTTYPQDGWVEQDPEAIWQGIDQSAHEALAKANISAQQILAIGVANQRETTLIWERKTGRPVHPAIVWQDRRTAAFCAGLRKQGLEPWLQARCGLLLDPYFSASKIRWLLDNVAGVSASAQRGELCFGTVDSWLIWKMTAGRHHVTDATNASRTALFNIHTQSWDDDLLAAFGIPSCLLPRVIDSAQNELTTAAGWLGVGIPIAGVAGDQQAALIGQNCILPNRLKATYGTGGFLILNTGQTPVLSQNKLLTTIAYRLQGNTTYAIEGAIFHVGTAIQWLREEIGLFDDPAMTAELAAKAKPNSRVMLVPAFTGMGAPYWESDARGLLAGLTRETGAAELVKAALDAAMFQTRDLITAMQRDGQATHALRIDGGMANNDWLCQRLADGLQLTVERPTGTEITAWGCALLAMLGTGRLASLDDSSGLWTCEVEFQPAISRTQADKDYAFWQTAVARTLLSP